MSYYVWINENPSATTPANDPERDTFMTQKDAQDCAKALLLEMFLKGFKRATADVAHPTEFGLPTYGLRNGSPVLVDGNEVTS